MNPLVSVITAAYNAENTIEQSMMSVLSQDYDNLELLVVINGCTDNTENIVKKIASNDKRVKIFYSEKGKVPSRNLGFFKSNGEILALNDSDDVWLPGKLSKQIKEIKNGYSVVGGRIECIDDNNRITNDPLNRPLNHQEIVINLLSGVNPIANSAAIFQKNLLNHIGTYEDCFPFCEDYHFWLRAIKFAKFKNVNDIVMRYKTHDSPEYDHNIPRALANFYLSIYKYTGVIL